MTIILIGIGTMFVAYKLSKALYPRWIAYLPASVFWIFFNTIPIWVAIGLQINWQSIWLPIVAIMETVWLVANLWFSPQTV